MKLRWPWKLEELRQKLILTPKEKRVIVFVVAAFVLGLGTKYYRDNHPQPIPYVDPKHPWRKQESPSAASPHDSKRSSRKPRKKITPTAAPLPTVAIPPSPSPADLESGSPRGQ